MNPKCEVRGCKADAAHKVGCNCHRGIYGAERHIISVCSDCRDELTNAYGYEMMFNTEELDGA